MQGCCPRALELKLYACFRNLIRIDKKKNNNNNNKDGVGSIFFSSPVFTMRRYFCLPWCEAKTGDAEAQLGTRVGG